MKNALICTQNIEGGTEIENKFTHIKEGCIKLGNIIEKTNGKIKSFCSYILVPLVN